MNKQLIQDIIKVGNKAIETESIKYAIITKDIYYYAYDGIYYDDNHIEFIDDANDDITLSYDEVVGIKVSDI